MSEQTIQSRIIKTEPIKWRDLQFIQQDNFKEWTNNGDKKLLESILKYQFADPFKVWHHNGINYCLDGKHRFLDLDKVSQEGYNVPEMLPATFIDCKDIQEAAELVLVYSSSYAKITQQGLLDFVQNFNLDFPDLSNILNIPEFDNIAFEGMLNSNGEPTEKIVPASLKDSFIFPPFSVLDTRQGEWQNRKRTWSGLFNSQETREDVELIAKSGQSTAIYELRNKMRESLKREPSWDEILDYAKKKGMHVYEGASIFDPVLCELSYRWFCPVGGRILDPFAGGSVRGIVAVAKLKDDRFACFVVGDVRDKHGFYYNFVSDTIQAFREAGMELYNEIILVNVVGSLAVRIRRQFNGGRKVGKMHQNVLVFYKGDPKKIKENYPELNLGELEAAEEVEIPQTA